MISDQLSRRFRVYPIEGGGGCSKTYEVTVTSEHQVLSWRKIPRAGPSGEAAAGLCRTWPRYEAREAKNSTAGPSGETATGFYRTWPRYEARKSKNSTGWTFGRGRSRVLLYVAKGWGLRGEKFHGLDLRARPQPDSVVVGRLTSYRPSFPYSACFPFLLFRPRARPFASRYQSRERAETAVWPSHPFSLYLVRSVWYFLYFLVFFPTVTTSGGWCGTKLDLFWFCTRKSICSLSTH